MKPETIKSKLERKAAIIAEYKTGMTAQQLADKYEIGLGYARVIIRDNNGYVAKAALKPQQVLLYAKRDQIIAQHYTRLCELVTAAHKKPAGAANNGYLMRVQNQMVAKNDI